MKLQISGDFSFNVMVSPRNFKLKNLVIPPKYTGVDVSLLTKYITLGYTREVTEKPFYFFDSGLPFNKIFSVINDVIPIEGQGFLVIGEHISQQ